MKKELAIPAEKSKLTYTANGDLVLELSELDTMNGRRLQKLFYSCIRELKNHQQATEARHELCTLFRKSP